MAIMDGLNKRIAKGETEAFVELYDQLGDRVLRYLGARLNWNDAHDVLQEVFVRLVRYRSRFAKSENLAGYVFLTARNEANRWLRKRDASLQQGHRQAKSIVVNEDRSAMSPLENRELANQLLGLLDQQSRDIIELKIYSELTFKEVAKIFGLPESTTATKYRRGIQKMQQDGIEENLPKGQKTNSLSSNSIIDPRG